MGRHARRNRLIGAFALVALVLPESGCGSSDPRQKVLEQRTRWSVELLAWTPADDGGFVVNTRVSGPVHSELRTLTVRIDLLDAAGGKLQEVWRSFDLSGFKRSGSKEVLVRLPAPEGVVEGMSLDPVLAPTPEQETHLEELRP